MNDLLRLGLALTQGATMLRQRRAAERLVWRTALIVAAASLAAAALGCVMAGLWISVAARYGAVAAALVVAMVLAVMSGGALALSRLRPRDRTPTVSGELAPAMLLGEVARLVLANKGVVLVAAALTGVILARRER